MLNKIVKIHFIIFLQVVNGVYLQNAVNKTTTTTTTTANPDWEGTTDIPEEIEVGEDVTTNNASIPTTPLAHGMIIYVDQSNTPI